MLRRSPALYLSLRRYFATCFSRRELHEFLSANPHSQPFTVPNRFTMTTVPQMRGPRACLICSIVRSQKQFMTEGCPNCEEILQLRNSPDAIAECTSSLFEGVITMADPRASWVAKWLRLSEYVPGIYAAKVQGALPEDIVDALRANGMVYIPRDGGEVEDAREVEE